MTHTLDDERTSPYAPEAAAGATRTPRLPEPPRFDDLMDDLTPEEATRVQLITERFAPRLNERAAGDEPATRPQPAAAARPDDSIFRAQSVATPSEALSPEEQQLAAERAARREAREQALAQPDVRAIPTPEPTVVVRRTTDRFLGAFALFVLRLVVAAILAVRGLEIVTNLPAAEALFATTILPEPRIVAMVTGGAALAIAVALVFGLLTRVAGLGVMLIAGGALAFVLWGNWSPFVAGRSGFVGELELLLVAVGLVFLCVGAGGFSLDRSFRKSRERDRPLEQTL
ncbi:MAG: DoxX family membrane protein [Micropruina sp.]|nr:DoxX family membrane protein [Micropruina sp.]